MKKLFLSLALICFTAIGVYTQELDSLEIYSTSFFHNDSLPMIVSCDGYDESPSLQWTGAPENTQSYAIIADDPDAPNGTWVHWVVYDIPRRVTSLEANQGKFKRMYHGAKHGLNDFGNNNFGGPCPPKGHGTHRYYFKIYALDTLLDLPVGSTKAELLNAMKNHIVAKGTIIGLYERK